MSELEHYGIKRRSGRYPYGSGEEPYQDEPNKRGAKQRSRRLSDVSDEELRSAISRMQLESQYLNLKKNIHADSTSAGKAFVSDIIKQVAVNSATNLLTDGTKYVVGTGINSLTGVKVYKQGYTAKPGLIKRGLDKLKKR